MGIACTMSRILQSSCGPTTRKLPPPAPPAPCFRYHPHELDPMTWVVDEPPPSWVMPVTYQWSDGHTDVSPDGEDAHEFALPGNYTIRGTDAEGRTCIVEVTVPT